MDPGAVENVLLLADSYKVTHYAQYPPGTTSVYSYFESRGGIFPCTIFFGLQYILKRWLVGNVVTEENIQEASEFFSAHFGQNVFNEDGWRHILKVHNGRLPIRIRAVPEGTLVPVKNVLLTVENTDPKVPWITNFVETLLVQVWYPITVATNSYYQKQIIAKSLKETGDNMSGLPYMLHDFGYRGSTSVESASIGGAAHLVNFKGTDTIAGIAMARKYYRCPMAGVSIPAAEHSTVTTWGREGESDAFTNMLQRFPNGPVSVVSDSYNVYAACEKIWGSELKSLVEERGLRGGCVVIRPDSGEPTVVVVKVLEIIGKAFGSTKNSKGYKLLPPYLRIIQGDGISYESLGKILESVKLAGWSAENLVFGSGGALLQRLDRDTQKFAFKCSCAVINGQEVPVFKQPVTDLGKTSKKGRLTLERIKGSFTTVEEGKGDSTKDILIPVFENGVMLQETTFDEVRYIAGMEFAN